MVNIFGKDYKVRDFNCGHNKEYLRTRNVGCLLYIRLLNSCNGKCKFCLNKNNTNQSNIDLKKLKIVLIELNNKKVISSVTITGGEPTLNIELLNNTINTIVEVIPNIRISISTNGTNLFEITKLDNFKNIEYIHISRHHYDDEINNKIFGFKTISSKEIKEFESLYGKIIINCVSIKNYIDNKETFKKMLEYVKNLNIKRIHFASLIDYGEYCRNNYIDIYKILEELEYDFYIEKVEDLYRSNYCECHFYKYKNLIIMGRLTHKNKCPYVNQFVYTSDNKLLTGFEGEEIKY